MRIFIIFRIGGSLYRTFLKNMFHYCWMSRLIFFYLFFSMSGMQNKQVGTETCPLYASHNIFNKEVGYPNNILHQHIGIGEHTHGFDANMQDSTRGYTSLMYAIENNDRDSCSEKVLKEYKKTIDYLLFRVGVDPNIQNEQGDTALILLTKYLNTRWLESYSQKNCIKREFFYSFYPFLQRRIRLMGDIVGLLYKAGADPYIRNNEGSDAFSYYAGYPSFLREKIGYLDNLFYWQFSEARRLGTALTRI